MVVEVEGKVFIITGAAGGIGEYVVRELVEANAKHVAALDVNEKQGFALRDDINSRFGQKVSFIKCDITNENQLSHVFKAVKDEHGYIDAVINNAGIMNDSLAVYKKEIEVNVTAVVTGTLKALKLMRMDQGGRGGTVVNISSVAGLSQRPLMPIYWATKSAVIQFSNCIGADEYYQRTGVRVITICFGKTNTALVALNNLGSYDTTIEQSFEEAFKSFPDQTPQSAAKGLMDVFKQAESGSTWIVTSNKSAKDITATIKKAYGLMEKHILE